jgi:hypothetical protein
MVFVRNYFVMPEMFEIFNLIPDEGKMTMIARTTAPMTMKAHGKIKCEEIFEG